MKPILVVPGMLALACAAGVCVLAGIARQPARYNPFLEWKHPITPTMLKATDAMATRSAPTFKSIDALGQHVAIGGRDLQRPQFVYFVNHSCPCSYAAEPLFHALADQFNGKISFVAVTNVGQADAKKWISENEVPYPVVPDPGVEIMRAFGAKSSAYSALITQDGRIRKMWPGFSKDLLLDMNRELAATLGEPEKSFDTLYAPEKPATGCSFY